MLLYLIEVYLFLMGNLLSHRTQLALLEEVDLVVGLGWFPGHGHSSEFVPTVNVLLSTKHS